jgi:large subunit ribosomal protein L32
VGCKLEAEQVGALPKKKVSRRRRDNRRSHINLTLAGLISCPNCRRLIPAYQACPNCGQFRGRQVLPVGSTGATGRAG